MVQYLDGSIVSQWGTPDMRMPIAYGLSWPQRMASGSENINFLSMPAMTFESVSDSAHMKRFPGLSLAWEALRAPSGTTAVLNASNEIAVAMFLNREIRFDQIHDVNRGTLSTFIPAVPQSLEDLIDIDQEARLVATKIASHCHS
jgi:1-deoxy-D-xylulose-5-phosphate reductoisomerase